MVLRINPEIFEIINKNELENDVDKILVQCLILEAKRYKTKYPRFKEDYDIIIENFLR